MKTAFFHIGLPKTGSSTIQVFLDMNRDVLAGHGIDYPPDPSMLGYAQGGIPVGNGFGIYCGLTTEEESGVRIPGDRRSGLEKFLYEVRASTADAVLYSTEFMCRLAPQRIEFLRDCFTRLGYRMKVIAYLRPQEELIPSAYSEAIAKNRFVGDLNAYIEAFADEFDFHKVLTKFSDALGDDAVSARVVRRGPDFDLLDDFVSSLGLTPSDEFQRAERAKRVNPRRSLEQLEVMMLFNASGTIAQVAGPLDHMMQEIQRKFADVDFAKMDLDAGLHEAIAARYEASNEALNSRFLTDGRELRVGSLAEPDQVGASGHERATTPVDEIQIALMSTFFSTLVNQRKRIDQLERELAALKAMIGADDPGANGLGADLQV